MTTITRQDKISTFSQYMQGRVSDSTLHSYVQNLQHFFNTLGEYELSPRLAQIYLDELKRAGKSPSTVSVRGYAIMNYFKSIGQTVHLDCPSIQFKTPDYRSVEDIQKIIDHCHTQLERTLVVVLFDTAVRISELLNLKVSDVDFKNKMITVVRKGGRHQEVNISDKGLTELRKWLNMRYGNDESVFQNLGYQSARKLIMAVGRRAGVDIHAHLFRHSRAISMLRSGVALNIVSQHLGHASITTTNDIYGQFTAIHLKEQIPAW